MAKTVKQISHFKGFFLTLCLKLSLLLSQILHKLCMYAINVWSRMELLFFSQAMGWYKKSSKGGTPTFCVCQKRRASTRRFAIQNKNHECVSSVQTLQQRELKGMSEPTLLIVFKGSGEGEGKKEHGGKKDIGNLSSLILVFVNIQTAFLTQKYWSMF